MIFVRVQVDWTSQHQTCPLTGRRTPTSEQCRCRSLQNNARPASHRCGIELTLYKWTGRLPVPCYGVSSLIPVRSHLKSCFWTCGIRLTCTWRNTYIFLFVCTQSGSLTYEVITPPEQYFVTSRTQVKRVDSGEIRSGIGTVSSNRWVVARHRLNYSDPTRPYISFCMYTNSLV